MKADDRSTTISPPPSDRPAEDNDSEDIETVPLYRKKRILIPFFLLIVVAAWAVWYWYTNFRAYDSTDDAYIDADRVAISSKMLGRITRLTVDEGDTVKAGQLLVRLDDSDVRAQEQLAKASFVSAEQNVALAKVNLEKADEDYQRAEKQFKDNVIPKEQFDHAQKARDVADAQQSIAVAQVGSARAQLGVAQTNLQNTIIVSPMDGIVSKRWALAGDVVQPAQPIFSIYNLGTVWVTANFEETKLSSIHLGDPVEISVDSYTQYRFHGKVIQLGSNTASQFSLIPPNNASGNFTKVTQRVPVKISLDPAPDSLASMPLLPGMSVEVKVKVK
ncbi:MAG: HlyD family secretion protein [Bacteroidota bacterium]|jgi:membrane fusion protein (multidrug efflux system)